MKNGWSRIMPVICCLFCLASIGCDYAGQQDGSANLNEMAAKIQGQMESIEAGLAKSRQLIEPATTMVDRTEDVVGRELIPTEAGAEVGNRLTRIAHGTQNVGTALTTGSPMAGPYSGAVAAIGGVVTVVGTIFGGIGTWLARRRARQLAAEQNRVANITRTAIETADALPGGGAAISKIAEAHDVDLEIAAAYKDSGLRERKSIASAPPMS